VRRPPVEEYVKTLAARAGLPVSTAKAAVELLKRNKRLLTGKNPWVWAAAALWLASFRRPGLLKRLAEAAGSTPWGVKDAAKKMRI
jgi:transcription initiation factor TFIIIB Brf1 subunit/transcription initiation factor TFIIB